MKGLCEGYLYRDEKPLLRTWLADHWWSRARGLLGRPRLQLGEALLLSPCSSVHGLGMLYPLDLLFLDDAGVIRRVTKLHPLGARGCRMANSTVECPPGTIAAAQFDIGQVLIWRVAQ